MSNVAVEENDAPTLRAFIWVLDRVELNSDLRCWSVGLHGARDHKLVRI